jgi:hypothetical protein
MVIKYEFDKCHDVQIHQGDIFQNVPFFESYVEKDGAFELSILEFPFAFVLSQECDLKQNCKERASFTATGSQVKKHDKFLVSLLCAPLYNAAHLFAGEHLSYLDIEAEKKGSKQKEFIKSNRESRYHYMEFDGEIEIVPSVIDFKHYFSISLPYLENNITNRICSIRPIFRESISQRFSNYLSRIGLPENKAIAEIVDRERASTTELNI